MRTLSFNMINGWTTNSSTPLVTTNNLSIDPNQTSDKVKWSHNVPQDMPWLNTLNGYSPSSVMIFNAPYSLEPVIPNQTFNLINGGVITPDPCTSQTATHWELMHNLSAGSVNSNLHLKRRIDSSDEDDEDSQRPVKRCMSEDKVAAKLNQMHISNDSMQFYSQDLNPINETFDEFDSEEDNEISETEKNTKLIYTDELQKALSSSDVIDKLVRTEMEKASKAVVLWKPPIGAIAQEIKDNCEELKSAKSSMSKEKVKVKMSGVSCDVNWFMPNEMLPDANDVMELE